MAKKLNKQIFLRGSVEAGFANLESLEAAKSDGDSLPTFSMLAYTGIAMNVGFGDDVLVDLKGMNLGNKNKPILLDHSTQKIVGHSVDAIKDESELRISGVVSANTESARTVLDSAKNDFPWQASIGLSIKKMRWVEENETVNANGKTFNGPLYFVSESKLNEVSFVVLGADENTESTVDVKKLVASLNEENEEDNGEVIMANEETKVEETTEVLVEASLPIKDEGEITMVDEVKVEAKIDNSVEMLRAEQARITEVSKVASDYPELQASAVKDGLSVAETKAAIFDIEAARESSEVNAAYVNTGAGKAEGDQVMEAAMLMQAGLKNVEKDFDEKTLDAADKQKSIPLRRMMEMCAASEGKQLMAGASISELVAAAYSTVSLPVILGNVANKSLVEGFGMAESVAAQVAEKLTTQNFHQHTGVKLGGVGLMEAVNGGEVKNGSFDEESFTFKTNTVAKILGLSRQDIINDDLGAFTRLSKNLGISAYKTRENDFWALVLANTGNFFGSTNTNIMTTALSITAIAEAEALLAAQTGIDGTPASITADFLVCPSQLGATARAIFTGTNVVGLTTITPDVNIFSGVYQPMVTPYLANSTVNASASETAWYLFSKMAAPFGISYLNGQETPTVEEVAPSAEYLGRCWRGYYDFGVCQIEHRSGVLSTGLGS